MTIWCNILKRKLKGYKLLFLMSIFPIMLTVLFVNMFTSVTKVEQNVAFSVALDRQEDGVLGDAVEVFLENVAESNNAGLTLAQEESADLRIEIDEQGEKLNIVNQEGGMVEEMTLASLLEEFATQYRTVQVIGLREVLELPIQSEKVAGKAVQDIQTPLVMTMLIFGIMLGGNFGIEQIFCMKQAVGVRTFTAPISKRALFLMEYTTSAFIVFIMGLISMVAYQLIFGIEFLQRFIGCAGLLLVASLLTTLLGMTIGLYVREQDMGENILSVIITFSAMLSGTLMPMFDLGKITQLSPIKPLVEGLGEWVEKGQFTDSFMLSGYLGLSFVILSVLVLVKLKKEGELE